jgi:hypothetical protein
MTKKNGAASKHKQKTPVAAIESVVLSERFPIVV